MNCNEKNNDNDDGKNEEGSVLEVIAALFAGITRSLLYAIKTSIPRGIIRNALRKRAFLTTIGTNSDSKHTSAIITNHIMDNVINITKRKSITYISKFAAFLKTGILGFAVFGIYDIVITRSLLWYNERQQESGNTVTTATTIEEANVGDKIVLTSDLNLVRMHTWLSPNRESTPLISHFVAGALSGLVNSIIVDTWEIINYWWNHRRQQQQQLMSSYQQHVRIGINHNFILRRLIHHSIGFATLFGLYEVIRRILVHEIFDYFTSGHGTVPYILEQLSKYKLINKYQNNQDGRYTYDMTFIPISTAYIAGGIAGCTHFVVNHYTRQWKLRAFHGNNTPATAPAPSSSFSGHTDNKSNKIQSKKIIKIKPPRIRATIATFVPTAICFVAFEYGGELAEKHFMQEYHNIRHPFPVYFISNPEI